MKQVIVIRKDLNMRKGKMIAQGCHASLGAYFNAKEADSELWLKNGQTKIAVSVESEAELLEIFQQAKNLKLPCALIKDAGHTELEPGTMTAVGIGPADDDEINKVTGKLKLL